jgi:hypothetical protein
MNFKSTALLFGLLLGMLWLFGLMLSTRKPPQDEGFVLPTMRGASLDLTVDWVKVLRKGKEPLELEFTREKDNWRMTQAPLGFSVRAKDFKVQQLINQIKDARKDDEADVTNDFAAYELGKDQPNIIVTLRGKIEEAKDFSKEKKSQTKEWTFYVGKETPAYVYVKSSDRDRVMAVKRSSLSNLFFKDPGAFRPDTFLEVNETTARFVGLKGEGSEVELRRSEDATWKFLMPNYGLADFEGKPAAPAKPPSPFQKEKEPTRTEGGVKGLLSAIGFIRVGSEADFVPLSDAPLASFGLDEKMPNIRIQVGTEGEKKEDAKDEKKDHLVKEILLIGNKVKDKDQYYARLATDRGIAKVDGKSLELILATLKSNGRNLRSRDVVPVDTKGVDAIDIKKGKSLAELMKLREANKAWRIYLGNDNYKADAKAVQGLIDALQGKGEIKELFDESEAEAKKDAERGLDQPQAEVVLYKDALEKEKEETKDLKSKKDKKEKDKKAKDDDKAKKEKKKDEEPKLKKDAKPIVTLSFGKADKDTVYVKRKTQDGLVSRFAVPKSILEKVLPAEGVLAFFDTALPSFELGNVTQFEVDKDGDKIMVEKGHGEQLGKFLLKNRKDYAGRNFADTAQVFTILQALGKLHAQKWIQKIGAKDDLKPFGLDKPGLVITVWATKDQVLPGTAASFIGLLGVPPLDQGLLAITSFQAGNEMDKGEAYVFKFGKEFKDKDTPVNYALSSKNDYLFQVPAGLVKLLKDADLRDRSWLSLFQPVLDAGIVSSGPESVLAAAPILTRQVLTFDAAKVKEVKLTILTRVEERTMAFVRNAKDKSWEDKSGLTKFSLDPEKVNELLKWLGDLKAERFIALTGGPREEQKLTKDASLKIDIVLDGGKTLTLTIGAALEGGYYAHSSAWADAVFLLPAGKIDPLLEGPGYFAKPRVAGQ